MPRTRPSLVRSVLDLAADRFRPRLKALRQALRYRLGRYPDSRLAGWRGERHLARILRGRGARIVARNFRCRYGEIDLIAIEAGTLLFVEIKTRRRYDAVDNPPIEVTRRQKHRIVRAALHFLRTRRLDAATTPIRFDVAVLARRGRRIELEEYRKGDFSIEVPD
jgi:putative endonuclease